MNEFPHDMTPQAKEWRKAALDLGCTFYYTGDPKYSNDWTIRAYIGDESAFQEDRARNPNWYVLNDAKAYGTQYALMIHHCDCSRLHSASTYNWPKLIAEKRDSLERWAAMNRPTNPVQTCAACVK